MLTGPPPKFHGTRDNLDWLWGTLTGFGVGAIVGPMVEPWSRRLQRFGRRAAAESPLDIHVEWDQALIWAGWPPWMSFSYFIPGDLPNEPTPEDGRDWSAWAGRHGGVDLRMTMLKVTIIARTPATVVLETPTVQQVVEPVPEGVGVLYPAPGGADVSPRRYDVQLDSATKPWVTFRGEGEQSRPTPSWKLGAGDVEQLHIWAAAEDDQLHRWTMTLPLLVDGRRDTVKVDRAGQPFVTVGENHPHRYLWRPNDDWQPWRSRQNPSETPRATPCRRNPS